MERGPKSKHTTEQFTFAYEQTKRQYSALMCLTG